MKTIFRLCLVAIVSFSALSCTKTDLSAPTGQPANPNNDPLITSNIERKIVEPFAAELGTSNAVFQQGDKITLFVPYSKANETITAARITMTDDATGETIDSYDLFSNNDPVAIDLTLPASLADRQKEFYFISFTVGEAYIGKTVSITTTLEGLYVQSSDVVTGAFTVLP